MDKRKECLGYVVLAISTKIGLWIKTSCCRAPPVFQAFVAAGCFLTLCADFSRRWLNILPQGSALLLEACRRTPPSATHLCREMAAQACCKPNVVDSLAYVGFPRGDLFKLSNVYHGTAPTAGVVGRAVACE